MVPANGMVHKLREELKNDGALLIGLILLAYLDIGGSVLLLIVSLVCLYVCFIFCPILALLS